MDSISCNWAAVFWRRFPRKLYSASRRRGFYLEFVWSFCVAKRIKLRPLIISSIQCTKQFLVLYYHSPPQPPPPPTPFLPLPLVCSAPLLSATILAPATTDMYALFLDFSISIKYLQSWLFTLFRPGGGGGGGKGGFWGPRKLWRCITSWQLKLSPPSLATCHKNLLRIFWQWRWSRGHQLWRFQGYYFLTPLVSEIRIIRF